MEIPATRARRSVSLSLPGLGTPPPTRLGVARGLRGDRGLCAFGDG